MVSKTPKGAERGPTGTSNGTRSSRSEIKRQAVAPKTLLDDGMSEDGSDLDQSNGVSLNPQEESTADHGFKVNEEYARRFEHNKKREELQRRRSSKLISYPLTRLTPRSPYSGGKVWQGLFASQT